MTNQRRREHPEKVAAKLANRDRGVPTTHPRVAEIYARMRAKLAKGKQ